MVIVALDQTHSDAPQSVGLLWKRNRPVQKTSITKHTTFTRNKSMHPAGFESAVPASERLQTHALDSAVTGVGDSYTVYPILHRKSCTQNTVSVNSIRVQAASVFELLRIQIFFFFPNFIYYYFFFCYSSSSLLCL